MRILLLGLIVLAGLLLWQRHQTGTERDKRKRAELEAGLRASEVLGAELSKAGALRPARLSGQVKSVGACASGGFFSNTQTTVAPYSANYLLDLSKVDRGDFRWNATDRIMFVEVPDVTVERPNVDTALARSAQTGIFISRACGLAMQRQVAARMDAIVNKTANGADKLDKARGMARDQLAHLLKAPLDAAGADAVEVRVRLASDPRPSGERWNASRSIEEILADPRLQP